MLITTAVKSTESRPIGLLFAFFWDYFQSVYSGYVKIRQVYVEKLLPILYCMKKSS